jgi:asparagine synthase (glutamine-hydrolysing)
MCGICGTAGTEDSALLKKMCDAIVHRGPDDSGEFLDSNIGLGFRRLSIIDISGGHQPVHNEDESIHVIFNGEIYNYKSLTEDLISKGHRFYTNSDTEVLVHLYEEYGESFVTNLRGMFAFAIWDSNRKRLQLARDRLGIKPLYYTFFNNIFLFASEIKSILQCEEFERKVNIDSLHRYLSFRCDPGTSTMFRNINKLAPGHILSFSNGNIEIKKYWDFRMSPQQGSIDYYSERLRKLLKECVKIRLMSEVPLGVYLSGGIDSSSVVAMMSDLVDEPIKTFSVGFGNRMDELPYAKQVADYFGTDHHEILVEADSYDILPEIVWHFDEPVADPAAIPTYLMSKATKKDVTVVLTGEGADEIFAGYEQYKILKYGRGFGTLPHSFKKILPMLVRKLPKSILDRLFAYSSSLGDEGINRFAKFMESLDKTGESYLEIVSIFTDDEKREIYTRGLADKINLEIAKELNESYFRGKSDLLNQLLYMETKTLLPENLLMKVDKMTMAHSIEARVPFLDHNMVEFASALPTNLKLNGMTGKYLLRKAMADLLPKEIIHRKKQRFFVPIDDWFEKKIKCDALRLFEESNVYQYFDKEKIITMIEKYDRSKLFYMRQLWSIINFAIWHKIYIEDSASSKSQVRRIWS